MWVTLAVAGILVVAVGVGRIAGAVENVSKVTERLIKWRRRKATAAKEAAEVAQREEDRRIEAEERERRVEADRQIQERERRRSTPIVSLRGVVPVDDMLSRQRRLKVSLHPAPDGTKGTVTELRVEKPGQEIEVHYFGLSTNRPSTGGVLVLPQRVLSYPMMVRICVPEDQTAVSTLLVRGETDDGTPFETRLETVNPFGTYNRAADEGS